jgi:hypothetical protein
MTYEERGKIYKEIWKFCESTWLTKGKDYATEEDVVANFKGSGTKYNITPEKALMVLFDKHLRAIDSYINKGELKGEGIESKILDCINYLGLLLCLIREKNG